MGNLFDNYDNRLTDINRTSQQVSKKRFHSFHFSSL